MTCARSAVAGILAMMLVVDVADAAEPPLEATGATPAVARYFDHGLSGSVQQLTRPWVPPVPVPRYGDFTPEHGNQWARPRAYSAPDGYRRRTPSWARRYGSRPYYYGDPERGGYRYGYAARPYYGFYEWQGPFPDRRSERRYGWRSDWRPPWRSGWRSY